MKTLFVDRPGEEGVIYAEGDVGQRVVFGEYQLIHHGPGVATRDDVDVDSGAGGESGEGGGVDTLHERVVGDERQRFGVQHLWLVGTSRDQDQQGSEQKGPSHRIDSF